MSDPDEDPAAAEYVLGTLDDAERAEFETRLKQDPALDGLVLAWEQRLAPLFEAVPETVPPSHVYGALVERLFGALGASKVTALADFRNLERSLRRWRAATGRSGGRMCRNGCRACGLDRAGATHAPGVEVCGRSAERCQFAGGSARCRYRSAKAHDAPGGGARAGEQGV